MELFSKDLLVILRLFAEGIISPKQLRAFLADRFFSDAPEAPLDHSLLGEMEGMLAEYERGDRKISNVRVKARELDDMVNLLAKQDINLLVRQTYEEGLAIA